MSFEFSSLNNSCFLLYHIAPSDNGGNSPASKRLADFVN